MRHILYAIYLFGFNFYYLYFCIDMFVICDRLFSCSCLVAEDKYKFNDILHHDTKFYHTEISNNIGNIETDSNFVMRRVIKSP